MGAILVLRTFAVVFELQEPLVSAQKFRISFDPKAGEASLRPVRAEYRFKINPPSRIEKNPSRGP